MTEYENKPDFSIIDVKNPVVSNENGTIDDNSSSKSVSNLPSDLQIRDFFSVAPNGKGFLKVPSLSDVRKIEPEKNEILSENTASINSQINGLDVPSNNGGAIINVNAKNTNNSNNRKQEFELKTVIAGKEIIISSHQQSGINNRCSVDKCKYCGKDFLKTGNFLKMHQDSCSYNNFKLCDDQNKDNIDVVAPKNEKNNLQIEEVKHEILADEDNIISKQNLALKYNPRSILNSNIVMKCNYCDRYFSENSDRKNEFGDCLIFTNHRETNPMKHCKVPNCSMKFCTSEGLILHQKNLHIPSVTTTKLELPKLPIVIQSSSPIMMPSTEEKQVSAMVDNNFKKCEWCDRTFAYDSDKMTEFGECKLFGVRREKNPMKHCNVCSMKFCTSEGLILHLKNSHKIEGNFTEILRQNTQAAYYNNQKSASHQKKQQIITATDLKIVHRVPSYNVISDKVYENLISSEKIMPVRTAEIIPFKQSINNTNSIQNNSFVGNFEDDQQNHSDSKLQNLKVAYQVVQTALKDKNKLQAIQQVLESKKDIVDEFNQKVLNNSCTIENQNGLEVSHNDDDDEPTEQDDGKNVNEIYEDFPKENFSLDPKSGSLILTKLKKKNSTTTFSDKSKKQINAESLGPNNDRHSSQNVIFPKPEVVLIPDKSIKSPDDDDSTTNSQFENVFDEFIHYAKERNMKRKQLLEVKKDPLEAVSATNNEEACGEENKVDDQFNFPKNPNSKDRALVSMEDVTGEGGEPTVYFGETLLISGGTARGAALQKFLAFIKSKYPEKYLAILQHKEFRSRNFEILTRVLSKDKECETCGKSFAKPERLIRHIHRVHKGKKENYDDQENDDKRCETCGKSFLNPWKLIRHIQRVHEGKEKNYYQETDTEDEISDEDDDNTPNANTETELNVNRTNKMNSDDQPDENLILEEAKYKCDSCEKTFPREKALSKHFENFHEGPNPCQFCNYSFKHSVLLEAHIIKVHEKDQESNMEQIFYMKKKSSQVMARWKNKKKASASIIKKNSKILLKNEYLENIKDEHESRIDELQQNGNDIEERGRDGNWYICDTCGKASSNKRNFRDHIYTIHVHPSFEEQIRKGGALYRLPDFKCKIPISGGRMCGQGFKNERALRKHIVKLHEGNEWTAAHEESLIQDCTCHICGKVFRYERGLKKHTTIVHEGKEWTEAHEELLLKKCENCEKSFKKPQELIKHIQRVHEGRKFHLCTVCGKEFFEESQLKSHINAVHEGKRDYPCHLCGNAFTRGYYLRKHISMVHETEKDKKCESCEKYFKTIKALEYHMRTVHEGIRDVHKCQKCSLSFRTKAGLRKHKHNDGYKDRFQCQSCLRIFDEEEILDKHVKKWHKKHQCTSCKMSFDDLYRLEKHIKRVHEGHEDFGQWKCDMCDKSFSKRHKLKIHSKVQHDVELLLTCNLCDKTFTQPKCLNNHSEKIHAFPCNNCGKAFVHGIEYKNHIYKIHGEDVLCEKCNVKFFKPESLKRHIIKFHTVKAIKCELCEKPVTGKQLESHINQDHEGYKDFFCGQFCNKVFKTEALFKRHKRIVHEDLNNYKCGHMCLYRSFPTEQKLKQHFQAVHEGQKVYGCDSCPKTYPILRHLKLHIYNTHEDHKDYQCNVCDKCFRHQNHLSKHVKSNHEVHEGFKCEICKDTFTAKNGLNGHIKIFHDESHPFWCRQCKKRFPSEKKLENHEQKKCKLRQTKQKPITFSMADLEVSSDEDEENQILDETKKNKATKDNSSELTEAKQNHNSNALYKCDICDENFDAKELLDRHIVQIHLENEIPETSITVNAENYGDSNTIATMSDDQASKGGQNLRMSDFSFNVARDDDGKKTYSLARLTNPDSIKKNAKVKEEEKDKHLKIQVEKMTKRKEYSLSYFTYPASDNTPNMDKGSSCTNNPVSFTMADLEEDQEISKKERLSSNHHRNELRHHEDKTKRNIIHKCKKCHRVFSRLVFLQSHKCVDSAQVEKLFDQTKPKYDVVHEDKNKQNEHHQVHKGINDIKKEQLSDEEVHKCDMCEKSFFTGKSLEAHRYTRHGKETKCDTCKESLVYREARGNRGRFFLQSHKCEFVHEEKNKQNKDHQVHKGTIIKKEQLSDEEIHKCDMCEKSFFTGKSLEAHRYTIHGKEIKCDSCKESFVYRETLEKHVRLFHEKNKNPINFSMADLETEKEQENDGGEYAGIGNNKGQIRKHNNNVKKEKRTEKEDNKRKITNQEMKESTIVNKSLQYDICEESFVKEVTLKNDKKKVHEDHKCEICDKSFIHSAALKQHICATYKDTSSEYRCEFCDKLFSKSDNLKTHVYTVHEGHKDYKCESCRKSFSHAHHLRRHIHTIHQGLKDHKCDSCDKSFSDSRNLKKHIQALHGGNKGYKCESCGKSFSEGGSLKKHVSEFHKSHKDYKCESCGKRFYQNIFLKKHVLTVHEGRKLQHQIDFKLKNKYVEKISRKLVSHQKMKTNYIRKRKPINFSMDDLEAEKDQENDGEFYFDNKENITGQIRKHNIKKEKHTEKVRNKRKATNQEIIEKTSQKIVKKRKPPINFSMTDLEIENDDE